MEWKKLMEIKNIGKEKLLLLGLAGIMLVGASYFESRNENHKTEQATTAPAMTEDYQKQTEEKVAALIQSIKGVTDVSVMISFRSGNEKVLQEDSEQSYAEKKEDSRSERSNTVKKSTVLFGQGGDESPYVIKELYPEVNGIAVAVKGMVDDAKKEEIIHMLSALFDIPVHKISVIEME